MEPLLRILSLEDDLNDFEFIRHSLEKEGIACELERVASREDFIAALDTNSFDLILADHSLPGFDGLSALEIAREKSPKVPFIFVSGALGEEVAIETLRSGATDYVLKTRLARLGPAVKRALREAKDRAERRLAEEAYRSVVMKSLQGLVLFQEGKIVFANPAMAAILGYSLNELLGFSPLEVSHLFHPDDGGFLRQAFVRSAAPTPAQSGREVRVFRKDGSVRWLSAFSSFAEYGGRTALQSAFVDITERKQAEGALRESEERYRLLVENSMDLVAEVTTDGTFLYASPNFKAILGYEPSELIHTNILANVHGRDLPEVRARFGEGSPTGVYRYRHQNGSWHWLESAGRRFRTPSGDEKFVIVSRDVTERKLAEQELEQSRKQLQRFTEHLENTLDEERKRMSREIHDELGQLLTILKFDISWITLNLPEGNQGLEEKVDGMMASIGEALASVKRISRELRPPQLDALGLCGAIQWDVANFSGKVGIHSTLRFSPTEFTLDRERSMVFYRVFHEALTNVARHAQATEVLIELDRKSDSVVLSVQDNGRGISRKELQGTLSLGLVGMRERVRPWNGTLTIVGKKGEGTTVTLQIPLDENSSKGTQL
jgi:PAS domain S-box-containing protein